MTWPECQDLPDSCLQLASKKPSPESIMVELLFPEQGHGPGPIFYQTFLRATPPLVKPDAPKHIIVHKKSLQRSTLLFRYRTTLCLFVTGQLFFFRYSISFSLELVRFVTTFLFRYRLSVLLQLVFFVSTLPFRYRSSFSLQPFLSVTISFFVVTTFPFLLPLSFSLQRIFFVTGLLVCCSAAFSLQLFLFVAAFSFRYNCPSRSIVSVLLQLFFFVSTLPYRYSSSFSFQLFRFCCNSFFSLQLFLCVIQLVLLVTALPVFLQPRLFVAALPFPFCYSSSISLQLFLVVRVLPFR